jgi:hypothetical protein
VTTKRGLAWPSVHSALATTRRWRLQLSRVVQAKSLKRRADLPVCWLCSAASASSALNLIDQPAIARQAEQEVDRVVLAPGHQRLAGKLLNAAGAGVDVGRAQFRDQ